MANYSLDQFRAYQNIHFIGIGGIGISALARILKKFNHQITGSDSSDSTNLELLIKEGFTIFNNHSEQNISDQTQLVIYTIAIPANNPELKKAQSLGITCLTYPQAVGLLTKSLNTISICGTHGKTTTTALVGLALTQNSLDPNLIVGALLKDFGGENFRAGDSTWLVLESCEYQDSFLNYNPQIVILTNVEIDHLDYFQDEERYLHSFSRFLDKIPEHGILIANSDDPNIQKLLQKKWPFSIITYGQTNNPDYLVGKTTITAPDLETIHLQLQIPGQHNITNSAAVLALSDYLGLARQQTVSALNSFQGANRRFEKKGRIGNSLIIDDYAHHPTEIRATIDSCREIINPDQKFLLVFQPHQYSRTFSLLNQFVDALCLADHVFIPNIYAARDSHEDIQKISAEKLVNLINLQSPGKAIYTENLDKTAIMIKAVADQYSLIITMGAGDITTLSKNLLH